MILKDEGPGVLNWALEGLKKLKENDWRFNLTINQSDLVDKVLLQMQQPAPIRKTMFNSGRK